ncbi:tryptophan 7-halogenase [Catenovulum maritimum]|uniref:Tryptophan halogenase n=1 Tax=Catenovulum maritimum TaxID=1513271 RepID=A0A0J8GMW2_9ALTE|nr:tryptophan 7-halogenase [Catenovulum maritimum]KMT64137.1 hypothetical protein XM47_15795 [Catenovulum maritimum]
MNSIKKLNQIAVLGNSCTAWLSAYTLAYKFKGIFEVLLITDEEPLQDSILSLSPKTRKFNELIGLDTTDLINAYKASYHFAYEFCHNASDSTANKFLLGYGQYGIQFDNASFFQAFNYIKHQDKHFSRLKSTKLENYCITNHLARHGQDILPSNNPNSPLSTHDYGLQVSELSLRNYIISKACKLGLTQYNNKVSSLDKAGCEIKSILLDSNKLLKPDLVIDCLTQNEEASDFEAWKELTPYNHKINDLNPAQSQGQSQVQTKVQSPCLIAQVVVNPDTIRLISNSQSTQQITKHSADQSLENLDNITKQNQESLIYKPGLYKYAWQSNVVKLNNCQPLLDNFVCSKIDLIQLNLNRLIDMLPSHTDFESIAKEYNRISIEEANHLRDFHLLLIHSKQIDNLANQNLPHSFLHKIKLFLEQGKYPKYDTDCVGYEIWQAYLLSLGIWPKYPDSLSLNLNSEKLLTALNQIYTVFSKINTDLSLANN